MPLMKSSSNLLQACLWSSALGILCLVVPRLAFIRPTADGPLSQQAKAIPWGQLAVKAEANYTGDGLAISATQGGARLNCAFQRLEGRATTEGLWLTSTMTNDRFRVVAVAVGRMANTVQPSSPWGKKRSSPRLPSGDKTSTDITGENLCNTWRLSGTGTVEVADKLVRFIRPSLVEEYTVSMDGVRQDFVLFDKPSGASIPASRLSNLAAPMEGPVRIELAVTGTKVESSASSVRLLTQSGRTIAYNRLRVTDTRGKELPSQMEVVTDGAQRSRRVDDTMTADNAPLLAVLVDDADAVYPIRIDPTFSDANWGSMGGLAGADFTVRAAVVDSSENLYIGGLFKVAGDYVANRIAKWNGNSWSVLGSGMNDTVVALAVSGSNLYAGGMFTTAGGIQANYVAKWDGSNWSALGSGMNFAVIALAVSGTNLYAGGQFITAGGNPANNVAKWNGNSWSALGEGTDGGVLALAMSGDSLYAGGAFTTAGGSPAKCIAKWDGSNWSALGSGMNDWVRALGVSGSNLYAGGDFTTAGGASASRIAKWNGTSWNALGSGMNNGVYALAVSGNDLYVGGAFSTAGGVDIGYGIAKWNGSRWSTVSLGTSSSVFALAVSGANLYAGGDFTTAGGSPAHRIGKWNGGGWSELASDSGVNGTVFALAVSGINLFAGGKFTMADGNPANHVAKWNGNSWSPLGEGTDGTVFALAVSGTNLYAGGEFIMADGNPVNHVAKWNGSSWSALGEGINNTVYALAVSGDDLYAGGQFSTAGGSWVYGIAKWNGSSWSALGGGMNNVVYALAVSGNDLYAGGQFTAPGNRIARWNGSSWSALSAGMNDVVYALAVSGNDLYAGGPFTRAAATPANFVARWNGSRWSALGLGIGGVVHALVVSGSDLYAAGTSSDRIAKWNGNSWNSLGSGLNSGNPFSDAAPAALAASSNDLYVGGGFSTAGGKVSAFIARAILGDAPGHNQLTVTSLIGETVKFSYVGYPATNYALDRAFSLTPPINWVGQKTNTVTVSGVLMFSNTPAPGTNNYWRVRSVP